jgi:hypothetical protein
VPSFLMDPLWAELEALLGSRPEFSPNEWCDQSIPGRR